jgi:hypothetical protein
MEAQIEINIPIVVFKEETVWYAHCPALDITGYGENEDEAVASFGVMLRETVEYMINHGTLDRELRRLGWKKTHGRPTPPPMEKLLRDNEELRRMMSLQHSLTYSSVPAF